MDEAHTQFGSFIAPKVHIMIIARLYSFVNIFQKNFREKLRLAFRLFGSRLRDNRFFVARAAVVS
jgi:hypothetical protein